MPQLGATIVKGHYRQGLSKPNMQFIFICNPITNPIPNPYAVWTSASSN